MEGGQASIPSTPRLQRVITLLRVPSRTTAAEVSATIAAVGDVVIGRPPPARARGRVALALPAPSNPAAEVVQRAVLETAPRLAYAEADRTYPPGLIVRLRPRERFP